MLIARILIPLEYIHVDHGNHQSQDVRKGQLKPKCHLAWIPLEYILPVNWTLQEYTAPQMLIAQTSIPQESIHVDHGNHQSLDVRKGRLKPKGWTPLESILPVNWTPQECTANLMPIAPISIPLESMLVVNQ